MSLLFPDGMQDERKFEAGMQDCKGSAEGMKLLVFIAEHGNCWVFWRKKGCTGKTVTKVTLHRV